MWVEIQCSINSGQYAKGDKIELPDNQSFILMQNGAAKKISNPNFVTKIIEKKKRRGRPKKKSLSH